MGQNLKVRETTVSFKRKQRHPLAKLRDKLYKETEDSVDVLIEVRDNKKNDDKTRKEAAKDILNYLIEATKIVEIDQMQRIIGQKRFPSDSRDLEVDDSPQLDFDTVQEVD